jgi:hypothetical protein
LARQEKRDRHAFGEFGKEGQARICRVRERGTGTHLPRSAPSGAWGRKCGLRKCVPVPNFRGVKMRACPSKGGTGTHLERGGKRDRHAFAEFGKEGQARIYLERGTGTRLPRSAPSRAWGRKCVERGTGTHLPSSAPSGAWGRKCVPEKMRACPQFSRREKMRACPQFPVRAWGRKCVPVPNFRGGGALPFAAFRG